MRKYFEILKNCLLFDGIPEQSLPELLGYLGASVQSFKKSRMIFCEGERAEKIGIVLSGSVQIITVDYSGNRNIVAAVAPSQLFGEAFVCAGTEELPVSAAAAEDSTVMLISGEKLMMPCCECGFHSRVIFNLMRVFAQKNLLLNQKVEILSKRTTREKLMTYLYGMAKSSYGESFTVPFDRQELADFLGVDRSGLSAQISSLVKEGVIECRKNRFRLCMGKTHNYSAE